MTVFQFQVKEANMLSFFPGSYKILDVKCTSVVKQYRKALHCFPD